MKKILLLVFLFASSCSTTEELLPGIVPDFITNYFKKEVKPYGDLPDFIKNVKVDLIWKKTFSGEIEDNDSGSYLNLYKFNEEIYIPTNEKIVYIISSESGELKNSIDSELDIFSNIIIDSKLLYFGSKQATVTAINRKDGSVFWQRLMSSEIMSISKFNDNEGVIYVRTNDSKISAINVRTGKFLWVNSQIPSSLSIRGTSPVLQEGDNVFAGFEDGKIVSYNSVNGDIVWQAELPAIKSEKINSFEIKLLNVRSYYYKNILAFGDMLHRIHPLAGQGFNMTIRDIQIFSEIIKKKLNLGLPFDISVNSEFQKKIKHKNFIFSNGVDLIYEFFNIERKMKTSYLSKSVKTISNYPFINKIFTKLADRGVLF